MSELPGPAHPRPVVLRRVLASGMLAVAACAALSACLFAPVIAETPTPADQQPASSVPGEQGGSTPTPETPTPTPTPSPSPTLTPSATL